MNRQFIAILWSALKKRSIPGVLIIAYRKTASGNKFLLIKHRHTKTITFPSGNLGWGENFKDAAKRELCEETGIKAKELSPLTMVHHFRYRNLPLKFKGFQKVFIARIKQVVQFQPKEKSIEWAKWFTPQETLKALAYPELRKTFREALRHL